MSTYRFILTNSQFETLTLNVDALEDIAKILLKDGYIVGRPSNEGRRSTVEQKIIMASHIVSVTQAGH
jgi:hypothetical protein